MAAVGATPEDAASATPGQEQAEAPPRKQGIGQYFRWRPLPWWLCFGLGVFLFAKLQIVYNDSPCAVLGTQSPVGMSDIKRAFRTLSMCTHPDRLRGRLKRQPTAEESRRGEIIFNRASAAKDELTKVIKSSKGKNGKGPSEVACYQGEMELAIILLMAELGNALSKLGIGDYASFAWETAWSLLSFKNGIMNTLFSGLWLAFVFRLIKQFVMYLWRLGIINFTVSLVTTIIIGPLPTVVHFLLLPFLRLYAFATDALGLKEKAAYNDAAYANNSTASPPDTGNADTQNTDAVTMNSSALRPAAKESALRNLRQRKKKETSEDKERRNKELLTGAGENANATGNDPTHGAGPMPENLWKCVNWSHREPVKARQEAANAVQFDFLLIMTKPIIPLFMLIALGQVWNGLISSLLIGHALRRWVPQMSHEAHHLLCAFFGALHTLLGVSAKQVEDYANSTGGKVLHLAWALSFKDILSIMHMMILGSTVTAMSALGNEPSYAASFAGGIALRIAIAQDSIRGLGIIRTLAGRVETGLRDLGIVLDAAEEVVAYSGGGIGDCGGGPFRMLFGDGNPARWAALALKVWLMLLPALSALQWLQRSVHAGRNLGKRFKTMRFCQRVLLCFLGLLQCFLIGRMELNASNGALDNFWVAMLIGCVGESLLSTYDIRGPVRQILFLGLFILI
mmetsp:Transcript_27625/g.82387  ORF Transcript_27625/g.82387 Transcript_27625/m.82387 type:complete len:682 (+) Transcript_27625:122-2167(+)